MYYDARVIKSSGSGSFLVHSDKLGRSLWMDVWLSKDGEVMCDWNKYIFYLNNSNDVEEMKLQRDFDVFDAFSSAAIEYFESFNLNEGGDMKPKSKTEETYITILEIENWNNECPNVGTITLENIDGKFKKAIESHFNAALISFSFVDEQVKHLSDCINASPIDVLVKLDVDGEVYEYRVELSQTWVY